MVTSHEIERFVEVIQRVKSNLRNIESTLLTLTAIPKYSRHPEIGQLMESINRLERLTKDQEQEIKYLHILTREEKHFVMAMKKSIT